MTASASPPSAPAGSEVPLAAEDYDWLDAELDALRAEDPGTPEWEFFEGAIAALVCTRRPVPAAEYWPVLLGSRFHPAQHLEFQWRWRRRWHEVQAALDADEVQQLEDPRCYHPEVLDVRGMAASLPQDERPDTGGAPLPAFARLWALGYLFVVDSWPEDWAAPRDAEASDILAGALAAVEALAGDDTAEPTVAMTEGGLPSASQARLDAYAQAIWAVYDLRLLWKSQGPRPAGTVRKEATPGRNDPCPCGSGRKYKRCHGA